MFDLRLLTPPYRRITWGSGEAPPLGAIAIAEASSVRRVTYELAPLVGRAPWCIPCLIVTAASAEPAVLSALHDVPGRPAFVSGPVADDLLPALVLAAVRDRPAPSGLHLAEYAVRRTGRVEFRPLLAGLLAAAAEDTGRPIPVRTLRDRLRRFGPLGPRCWRTLGTLCRVAATMGGSGLEVLAWRAGVSPRSLRSWIRRYLGASLQDFRLNAGWEWVLEAALRRAGYVDAVPGPGRGPAAALPRSVWSPPARAAPRRPVSGRGGPLPGPVSAP